MSITYPLSLPDNGISPVSTSWNLTAAVGLVESGFTFQTSKQLYDGERWIIDASYPRMESERAGPWRAFFAMLRGMHGTFLFGDVTRPEPLGAISSMVSPAPVVDGAGAVGNSLAIKGLSNSVADAFVAGDWIQLGSGANSRLHMVVQNASTNGSGRTTLTIVPELRESPLDEAVITWTNCRGVFRFPQNDVSIFQTSGPDHSQFRLQGIEAV